MTKPKTKQVRKKTAKSKSANSTVVSHNVFYGVKWDQEALEAVNAVARGLENMSQLFKSQNITIDALLKIDNIDITEVNEEIENNET